VKTKEKINMQLREACGASGFCRDDSENRPFSRDARPKGLIRIIALYLERPCVSVWHARRNIKLQLFVILNLIFIAKAFSSEHIEFFPRQTPGFIASELEFRNYIFVGSENDRTVNHGNIGVDIPVAGYALDSVRNYYAGIAAATHLVMYPNNMKFAVDNLYATLALYVETQRSSALSFRLYPVYHVSGHLVDGSKNDSALTHARAVSSEMVKLESAYTPFRYLSLSAGYGYYYHVCAQQGLTDRFDLGLELHTDIATWLRPYCALSGQFIYLSHEWRARIDLEAGAKFLNSRGRGIGVSFRYFNRMDPGYYFDRREKSAGGQIDFLM
jgi:hypothetical protein